jgi:hypothetical protein
MVETDGTQQRILLLAHDYVQIVEQMRQGVYTDMQEWAQLAAERTLIHDELIALTGVTERKMMYAHCRTLTAQSHQAAVVVGVSTAVCTVSDP